MSPEQHWWLEDEQKRMGDRMRRDIVTVVCQMLVIGTLLVTVWMLLHGRTW